MRVDRVIVVSPRKSGTHLVQEMMTSFGYQVHGETVPPLDAVVALSPQERMELARRHLRADALAALDWRRDREEFVRVTNLLWYQVAAMWQVRLSSVRVPHTELAQPERDQRVPLSPDAWRRPFADTPANICWTFHSIDVWHVDHDFYREWQEDWRPRIVVNVRDPRDTLISMVNFLSGDSGHVFSRQPELAVFRPILAAIPDLASRVAYALREPALPLLADFEAAISLYHHPHVCAVTFEDLIGPLGGGSAARQRAAVERVAAHLESDADPAAIAEKLFNREAYSFHRGATGAWREVFGKRHHDLFERRFGHLLEIFDYA
ncbi:MAG TPA: hypothetical protein VFV66_17375 [Nonomuraea sp.]|nr:hypothetical protein [Nonomuraea sp.]